MTAAENTDTSPSAAQQAPLFTVTAGNPSPVDVGILSALFATAQGNAAHASDEQDGIRDHWGANEDRLRTTFGYNPASFLNRRQY